jgi:hypothetical protein
MNQKLLKKNENQEELDMLWKLKVDEWKEKSNQYMHLLVVCIIKILLDLKKN